MIRRCGNPLCTLPLDKEEQFCDDCVAEFSLKELEIMQALKASMHDVLIRAAQRFSTVQAIADYLDVSPPTIYGWLRKYHRGISFKQFKRKYICPQISKTGCSVIDFDSTGYSWKYTMADSIRAKSGCQCFVEGATGSQSSTLMMTTLPPLEVAEILRAEVPFDADTGIYHIRYPVRLPILREVNTERTPVIVVDPTTGESRSLFPFIVADTGHSVAERTAPPRFSSRRRVTTEAEDKS